MEKLCISCRRNMDRCLCVKAANDDQAFGPNFIRIPADDILMRLSTVHRLAIAYGGMALPRRAIVGFVGDQIYAFWEAEGIAVIHGRQIELLDIDLEEIFNTEVDWSHRWLGRFLAFGVTPPQQKAQKQVVDRLRMLWLALAIKRRPQAEIVLW